MDDEDDNPLLITVEEFDALELEIIEGQQSAFAKGIADGTVVPFPAKEDE